MKGHKTASLFKGREKRKRGKQEKEGEKEKGKEGGKKKRREGKKDTRNGGWQGLSFIFFALQLGVKSCPGLLP